MTLARARVIRAGRSTELPRPAAPSARRVPADVLAAKAEATRIVAEAQASVADVAATAAREAGREAREAETARLAAGFLALREEDARRLERDADRLVELAVLLAERLVGEAIRVEPARIAELAAAAIEEARGAREVTIDASPDDVTALEASLALVGQRAVVRPDDTLARGSLVVHTDLGHIDARLEPQLARLAIALREALT